MTTPAADTTNSPPRPKRQRLSTPQSQGSASVSDSSSIGLQVPKIHPWIARDVEKCVKCPIDNMLSTFLADCTQDPERSWDGEKLLDNCLAHVLPICNGVAMSKDGQKSSDIRRWLEIYSENNSQEETALYPPLSRAANTALMCLESVKVPGIRDCGSTPVYFHVDDPLLIKQTHRGLESRRKPDLVVVTMDDARYVHDSGASGSRVDDSFLDLASKPPKIPFEWRSIRTFVECESTKKKLQPPPASYTRKAYTSPPKYQYLASDSLMDELESGQPESVLQSDQLTNVSGAVKRSAAHLEVPESSSKRAKPEDKADHPVVFQAGSYAAEMFAAYAARQHVIGLVVLNDLLYIWRYDRQGPIQCSALNFIQDLPRFLVLLLAMQRFQDRHWGLSTIIDITFEPQESTNHRHVRPELTLHDVEGNEVDVTLNLSSTDQVSHFGLNGRATNVFLVEHTNAPSEDGYVAKIFWAEESRMSEPDILKKVYEVAAKEPDIQDHVPAMVCYEKFSDTSTANIRERLGLNTDGARVLYVIIFGKLNPITRLSGDDFLHAWWATVKCHYVLWKNGIYHRDISPSNLTYRLVNNLIIGVLNDFDLALTEECPTGTERTGTVPFMAHNLLRPAGLEGRIKHLYQHDAESFIWVLLWITTRYEKGMLKTANRPLDLWLTLDAQRCCEKKAEFLLHGNWTELTASPDHQNNFLLAVRCMRVLLAYSISSQLEDIPRVLEVDTAFQLLLNGPFLENQPA